MAKGKQRDAWDRTAALLCLSANIARDPKKSPVPYSKFHPFAAEMKAPEDSRIIKGTVHDLKGLFGVTTAN